MNTVNASNAGLATTTYFKPLFTILPSSFDPSKIISIVFFVIFIIWLIYTIVAAYHWFRYSHRSWVAVPAMGVHIFISGAIFLYMIAGLQ